MCVQGSGPNRYGCTRICLKSLNNFGESADENLVSVAFDLIDRSGPGILRVRTLIYAGLGLVLVASALFGRDMRLEAMLPIIAAALVLPWLASSYGRLFCALAIDSGVALASWWLFGPSAGTDFVLLVVAAAAALVFEGSSRGWLISLVLLAEASQIPLHLWASNRGPLPLFHSPSQVVSTAEFITGVALRLGLLVLASMLFALVGRSLKASRSALSASEAMFRGAFQEAPVGVALLSVDGVVLRANKRIDLLAGLDGNEHFKGLIELLFNPEDRAAVRGAITAAVNRDNDHIDLELTSSAGGKIRTLRATLAPVEQSQGDVAAVVTVEDVTERVENLQRLQELVRSKDEFVASVSHELRTPLTAVVGFSDILEATWRDLPAEELDTLIGDISRESREVSSIVEDLLVIARADIGTVTLIPDLFEFESQLESVVAGFSAVDRSRITFDCTSCWVWGDPIRFRQVLRNLLTNALRYGGNHVRVCSMAAEDNVEIIVEDDGEGVIGDDPERIFQPYVRAHDNPTQPASVGLGLAVSRSLARAMGGDLVYQRVDGLTRFRLTIPAVPATAPVEASG